MRCRRRGFGIGQPVFGGCRDVAACGRRVSLVDTGGQCRRFFFDQGFPGHEFYWLFAVVGFLGGFTTFSAFSYELLLMLQKQQYALFALNVSLHAAGCLAAVIAGYHVSKIIFS